MSTSTRREVTVGDAHSTTLSLIESGYVALYEERFTHALSSVPLDPQERGIYIDPLMPDPAVDELLNDAIRALAPALMLSLVPVPRSTRHSPAAPDKLQQALRALREQANHNDIGPALDRARAALGHPACLNIPNCPCRNEASADG